MYFCKSYSNMNYIYISTILVTMFLSTIYGKRPYFARLSDPPMRRSLWRHGYQTVTDLNDGAPCHNQTNPESSKCSVCGKGPVVGPIVVKQYTKDRPMEVKVTRSLRQKGHVEFSMCEKADDVTEECFKNYVMEVLNTKTLTTTIDETEYVTLAPPTLSCSHCVLRWRFTTDDNIYTYVGCADVSILDPVPDIYDVQYLERRKRQAVDLTQQSTTSSSTLVTSTDVNSGTSGTFSSNVGTVSSGTSLSSGDLFSSGTTSSSSGLSTGDFTSTNNMIASSGINSTESGTSFNGTNSTDSGISSSGTFSTDSGSSFGLPSDYTISSYTDGTTLLNTDMSPTGSTYPNTDMSPTGSTYPNTDISSRSTQPDNLGTPSNSYHYSTFSFPPFSTQYENAADIRRNVDGQAEEILSTDIPTRFTNMRGHDATSGNVFYSGNIAGEYGRATDSHAEYHISPGTGGPRGQSTSHTSAGLNVGTNYPTTLASNTNAHSGTGETTFHLDPKLRETESVFHYSPDVSRTQTSASVKMTSGSMDVTQPAKIQHASHEPVDTVTGENIFHFTPDATNTQNSETIFNFASQSTNVSPGETTLQTSAPLDTTRSAQTHYASSGVEHTSTGENVFHFTPDSANPQPGEPVFHFQDNANIQPMEAISSKPFNTEQNKTSSNMEPASASTTLDTFITTNVSEGNATDAYESTTMPVITLAVNEGPNRAEASVDSRTGTTNILNIGDKFSMSSLGITGDSNMHAGTNKNFVTTTPSGITISVNEGPDRYVPSHTDVRTANTNTLRVGAEESTTYGSNHDNNSSTTQGMEYSSTHLEATSTGQIQNSRVANTNSLIIGAEGTTTDSAPNGTASGNSLTVTTNSEANSGISEQQSLNGISYNIPTMDRAPGDTNSHVNTEQIALVASGSVNTEPGIRYDSPMSTHNEQAIRVEENQVHTSGIVDNVHHYPVDNLGVQDINTPIRDTGLNPSQTTQYVDGYVTSGTGSLSSHTDSRNPSRGVTMDHHNMATGGGVSMLGDFSMDALVLADNKVSKTNIPGTSGIPIGGSVARNGVPEPTTGLLLDNATPASGSDYKTSTVHGESTSVDGTVPVSISSGSSQAGTSGLSAGGSMREQQSHSSRTSSTDNHFIPPVPSGLRLDVQDNSNTFTPNDATYASDTAVHHTNTASTNAVHNANTGSSNGMLVSDGFTVHQPTDTGSMDTSMSAVDASFSSSISGANAGRTFDHTSGTGAGKTIDYTSGANAGQTFDHTSGIGSGQTIDHTSGANVGQSFDHTSGTGAGQIVDYTTSGANNGQTFDHTSGTGAGQIVDHTSSGGQTFEQTSGTGAGQTFDHTSSTHAGQTVDYTSSGGKTFEQTSGTGAGQTIDHTSGTGAGQTIGYTTSGANAGQTFDHTSGIGDSQTFDHTSGTGAGQTFDYASGANAGQTFDHTSGIGAGQTIDYTFGANAGQTFDHTSGTGAGQTIDYTSGANAGQTFDHTSGIDTGQTFDHTSGTGAGQTIDHTSGANVGKTFDHTSGTGVGQTIDYTTSGANVGQTFDHTSGTGAGQTIDHTSGANVGQTFDHTSETGAGQIVDYTTSGANADQTFDHTSGTGAGQIVDYTASGANANQTFDHTSRTGAGQTIDYTSGTGAGQIVDFTSSGGQTFEQTSGTGAGQTFDHTSGTHAGQTVDYTSSGGQTFEQTSGTGAGQTFDHKSGTNAGQTVDYTSSGGQTFEQTSGTGAGQTFDHTSGTNAGQTVDHTSSGGQTFEQTSGTGAGQTFDHTSGTNAGQTVDFTSSGGQKSEQTSGTGAGQTFDHTSGTGAGQIVDFTSSGGQTFEQTSGTGAGQTFDHTSGTHAGQTVDYTSSGGQTFEQTSGTGAGQTFDHTSGTNAGQTVDFTSSGGQTFEQTSGTGAGQTFDHTSGTNAGQIVDHTSSGGQTFEQTSGTGAGQTFDHTSGTNAGQTVDFTSSGGQTFEQTSGTGAGQTFDHTSGTNAGQTVDFTSSGGQKFEQTSGTGAGQTFDHTSGTNAGQIVDHTSSGGQTFEQTSGTGAGQTFDHTSGTNAGQTVDYTKSAADSSHTFDHTSRTSAGQTIDYNTSGAHAGQTFKHTSGTGDGHTIDYTSGAGAGQTFDYTTSANAGQTFDHTSGTGAGQTFDHSSGTGGGQTIDHTSGANAGQTFDHTSGTGGGQTIVHTSGSNVGQTIDYTSGANIGDTFDHTSGTIEGQTIDYASGVNAGQSFDHTSGTIEGQTIDYASGGNAGQTFDHTSGSSAGQGIDHSSGSNAGQTFDHTSGTIEGQTIDYASGVNGGQSFDHTSGTIDHSSGANAGQTFDHTSGSNAGQTFDHISGSSAGQGIDHSSGANAGQPFDHTSGTIDYTSGTSAGHGIDHSSGANADQTFDHTTGTSAAKTIVYTTSGGTEGSMGRSQKLATETTGNGGFAINDKGLALGDGSVDLVNNAATITDTLEPELGSVAGFNHIDHHNYNLVNKDHTSGAAKDKSAYVSGQTSSSGQDLTNTFKENSNFANNAYGEQQITPFRSGEAGQRTGSAVTETGSEIYEVKDQNSVIGFIPPVPTALHGSMSGGNKVAIKQSDIFHSSTGSGGTNNIDTGSDTQSIHGNVVLMSDSYDAGAQMSDQPVGNTVIQHSKISSSVVESGSQNIDSSNIVNGSVTANSRADATLSPGVHVIRNKDNQIVSASSANQFISIDVKPADQNKYNQADHASTVSTETHSSTSGFTHDAPTVTGDHSGWQESRVHQSTSSVTSDTQPLPTVGNGERPASLSDYTTNQPGNAASDVNSVATNNVQESNSVSQQFSSATPSSVYENIGQQGNSNINTEVTTIPSDQPIYTDNAVTYTTEGSVTSNKVTSGKQVSTQVVRVVDVPNMVRDPPDMANPPDFHKATAPGALLHTPSNVQNNVDMTSLIAFTEIQSTVGTDNLQNASDSVSSVYGSGNKLSGNGDTTNTVEKASLPVVDGSYQPTPAYDIHSSYGEFTSLIADTGNTVINYTEPTSHADTASVNEVSLVSTSTSGNQGPVDNTLTQLPSDLPSNPAVQYVPIGPKSVDMSSLEALTEVRSVMGTTYQDPVITSQVVATSDSYTNSNNSTPDSYIGTHAGIHGDQLINNEATYVPTSTESHLNANYVHTGSSSAQTSHGTADYITVDSTSNPNHGAATQNSIDASVNNHVHDTHTDANQANEGTFSDINVMTANSDGTHVQHAQNTGATLDSNNYAGNTVMPSFDKMSVNQNKNVGTGTDKNNANTWTLREIHMTTKVHNTVDTATGHVTSSPQQEQYTTSGHRTDSVLTEPTTSHHVGIDATNQGNTAGHTDFSSYQDGLTSGNVVDGSSKHQGDLKSVHLIETSNTDAYSPNSGVSTGFKESFQQQVELASGHSVDRGLIDSKQHQGIESSSSGVDMGLTESTQYQVDKSSSLGIDTGLSDPSQHQQIVASGSSVDASLIESTIHGVDTGLLDPSSHQQSVASGSSVDASLIESTIHGVDTGLLDPFQHQQSVASGSGVDASLIESTIHGVDTGSLRASQQKEGGISGHDVNLGLIEQASHQVDMISGNTQDTIPSRNSNANRIDMNSVNMKDLSMIQEHTRSTATTTTASSSVNDGTTPVHYESTHKPVVSGNSQKQAVVDLHSLNALTEVRSSTDPSGFEYVSGMTSETPVPSTAEPGNAQFYTINTHDTTKTTTTQFESSGVPNNHHDSTGHQNSQNTNEATQTSQFDIAGSPSSQFDSTGVRAGQFESVGTGTQNLVTETKTSQFERTGSNTNLFESTGTPTDQYDILGTVNNIEAGRISGSQYKTIGTQGTPFEIPGAPSNQLENMGTLAGQFDSLGTASNIETGGIVSSQVNTIGTQGALFETSGTQNNQLDGTGVRADQYDSFGTAIKTETGGISSTTNLETTGTLNNQFGNTETLTGQYDSLGTNNNVGTGEISSSNFETAGTSTNQFGNTEPPISQYERSGTANNIETGGISSTQFETIGTQGTHFETSGTQNNKLEGTGVGTGQYDSLGIANNIEAGGISSTQFKTTGTSSNRFGNTETLVGQIERSGTANNIETGGISGTQFETPGIPSIQLEGIGTMSGQFETLGTANNIESTGTSSNQFGSTGTPTGQYEIQGTASNIETGGVSSNNFETTGASNNQFDSTAGLTGQHESLGTGNNVESGGLSSSQFETIGTQGNQYETSGTRNNQLDGTGVLTGQYENLVTASNIETGGVSSNNFETTGMPSNQFDSTTGLTGQYENLETGNNVGSGGLSTIQFETIRTQGNQFEKPGTPSNQLENTGTLTDQLESLGTANNIEAGAISSTQFETIGTQGTQFESSVTSNNKLEGTGVGTGQYDSLGTTNNNEAGGISSTQFKTTGTPSDHFGNTETLTGQIESVGTGTQNLVTETKTSQFETTGLNSNLFESTGTPTEQYDILGTVNNIEAGGISGSQYETIGTQGTQFETPGAPSNQLENMGTLTGQYENLGTTNNIETGGMSSSNYETTGTLSNQVDSRGTSTGQYENLGTGNNIETAGLASTRFEAIGTQGAQFESSGLSSNPSEGTGVETVQYDSLGTANNIETGVRANTQFETIGTQGTQFETPGIPSNPSEGTGTLTSQYENPGTANNIERIGTHGSHFETSGSSSNQMIGTGAETGHFDTLGTASNIETGGITNTLSENIGSQGAQFEPPGMPSNQFENKGTVADQLEISKTANNVGTGGIASSQVETIRTHGSHFETPGSSSNLLEGAGIGTGQYENLGTASNIETGGISNTNIETTGTTSNQFDSTTGLTGQYENLGTGNNVESGGIIGTQFETIGTQGNQYETSGTQNNQLDGTGVRAGHLDTLGTGINVKTGGISNTNLKTTGTLSNQFDSTTGLTGQYENLGTGNNVETGGITSTQFETTGTQGTQFESPGMPSNQLEGTGTLAGQYDGTANNIEMGGISSTHFETIAQQETRFETSGTPNNPLQGTGVGTGHYDSLGTANTIETQGSQLNTKETEHRLSLGASSATGTRETSPTNIESHYIIPGVDEQLKGGNSVSTNSGSTLLSVEGMSLGTASDNTYTPDQAVAPLQSSGPGGLSVTSSNLQTEPAVTFNQINTIQPDTSAASDTLRLSERDAMAIYNLIKQLIESARRPDLIPVLNTIIASGKDISRSKLMDFLDIISSIVTRKQLLSITNIMTSAGDGGNYGTGQTNTDTFGTNMETNAHVADTALTGNNAIIGRMDNPTGSSGSVVTTVTSHFSQSSNRPQTNADIGPNVGDLGTTNVISENKNALETSHSTLTNELRKPSLNGQASRGNIANSVSGNEGISTTTTGQYLNTETQPVSADKHSSETLTINTVLHGGMSGTGTGMVGDTTANHDAIQSSTSSTSSNATPVYDAGLQSGNTNIMSIESINTFESGVGSNLVPGSQGEPVGMTSTTDGTVNTYDTAGTNNLLESGSTSITFESINMGTQGGSAPVTSESIASINTASQNTIAKSEVPVVANGANSVSENNNFHLQAPDPSTSSASGSVTILESTGTGYVTHDLPQGGGFVEGNNQILPVAPATSLSTGLNSDVYAPEYVHSNNGLNTLVASGHNSVSMTGTNSGGPVNGDPIGLSTTLFEKTSSSVSIPLVAGSIGAQNEVQAKGLYTERVGSTNDLSNVNTGSGTTYREGSGTIGILHSSGTGAHSDAPSSIIHSNQAFDTTSLTEGTGQLADSASLSAATETGSQFVGDSSLLGVGDSTLIQTGSQLKSRTTPTGPENQSIGSTSYTDSGASTHIETLSNHSSGSTIVDTGIPTQKEAIGSTISGSTVNNAGTKTQITSSLEYQQGGATGNLGELHSSSSSNFGNGVNDTLANGNAMMQNHDLFTGSNVGMVDMNTNMLEFMPNQNTLATSNSISENTLNTGNTLSNGGSSLMPGNNIDGVQTGIGTDIHTNTLETVPTGQLPEGTSLSMAGSHFNAISTQTGRQLSGGTTLTETGSYHTDVNSGSKLAAAAGSNLNSGTTLSETRHISDNVLTNTGGQFNQDSTQTGSQLSLTGNADQSNGGFNSGSTLIQAGGQLTGGSQLYVSGGQINSESTMTNTGNQFSTGSMLPETGRLSGSGLTITETNRGINGGSTLYETKKQVGGRSTLTETGSITIGEPSLTETGSGVNTKTMLTVTGGQLTGSSTAKEPRSEYAGTSVSTGVGGQTETLSGISGTESSLASGPGYVSGSSTLTEVLTGQDTGILISDKVKGKHGQVVTPDVHGSAGTAGSSYTGATLTETTGQFTGSFDTPSTLTSNRESSGHSGSSSLVEGGHIATNTVSGSGSQKIGGPFQPIEYSGARRADIKDTSFTASQTLSSKKETSFTGTNPSSSLNAIGGDFGTSNILSNSQAISSNLNRENLLGNNIRASKDIRQNTETQFVPYQGPRSGVNSNTRVITQTSESVSTGTQEPSPILDLPPPPHSFLIPAPVHDLLLKTQKPSTRPLQPLSSGSNVRTTLEQAIIQAKAESAPITNTRITSTRSFQPNWSENTLGSGIQASGQGSKQAKSSTSSSFLNTASSSLPQQTTKSLWELSKDLISRRQLLSNAKALANIGLLRGRATDINSILNRLSGSSSSNSFLPTFKTKQAETAVSLDSPMSIKSLVTSSRVTQNRFNSPARSTAEQKRLENILNGRMTTNIPSLSYSAVSTSPSGVVKTTKHTSTSQTSSLPPISSGLNSVISSLIRNGPGIPAQHLQNANVQIDNVIRLSGSTTRGAGKSTTAADSKIKISGIGTGNTAGNLLQLDGSQNNANSVNTLVGSGSNLVTSSNNNKNTISRGVKDGNGIVAGSSNSKIDLTRTINGNSGGSNTNVITAGNKKVTEVTNQEIVNGAETNTRTTQTSEGGAGGIRSSTTTVTTRTTSRPGSGAFHKGDTLASNGVSSTGFRSTTSSTTIISGRESQSVCPGQSLMCGAKGTFSKTIGSNLWCINSCLIDRRMCRSEKCECSCTSTLSYYQQVIGLPGSSSSGTMWNNGGRTVTTSSTLQTLKPFGEFTFGKSSSTAKPSGSVQTVETLKTTKSFGNTKLSDSRNGFGTGFSANNALSSSRRGSNSGASVQSVSQSSSVQGTSGVQTDGGIMKCKGKGAFAAVGGMVSWCETECSRTMNVECHRNTCECWYVT